MPMVGGSDRGGRRRDDLLAPGPYLLALVWFQRKTGRDSGRRYLRVKYQVIGGRAKGASFFDMISLDLSKPGTVTRWQIFSDAVGVQEPFELGSWEEDNEDEGDENLRRLFLRQPFGADVSKEKDGQYRNNRIQQFIFRKNWKDVWHEWAHEWQEAQAARSRRAPEEGLEDPEPNSPEDVGYTPAGGDEYSAGDGFRGGDEEFESAGGADPDAPAAPPPPFADDPDDIPFD